MAPILGVVGGVVGVADTVPYVRDTVRGSTRPHRGTWLIWGVLAVVVCLAQRADGASWSLVLTATQAVLTVAVFTLAIRHGEGGLAWDALASVGGALAAGAVGALDVSLLLYPVYYCIANAAMALLIFQWRR
jgi:hypothetical protein